MEKLSPSAFADFLLARAKAKDGYIMGAIGQDPKKWSKGSWYFTQYSGAQKTKALYWREHAERVWDCQGLAEGYINDMRGTSINVRARNNYAAWCDPRGSGKIPPDMRVPGAAVFIHNGSYISHVGYLVEPVDADKPRGDWWVVEARGVMYGVVKTKLSQRSWNRWGWMTKYFAYDGTAEVDPPEFGERVLRRGCMGSDVKQLQEALIALHYSCGKWGADGEFGQATEAALRAFQRDQGLAEDGIANTDDYAALEDALPDADEPPVAVTGPGIASYVRVTGASVNVRAEPSTSAAVRGVVRAGEIYPYEGEASGTWRAILYAGERAWISSKYAEVTVDAPVVVAPGTVEALTPCVVFPDLSQHNGRIGDARALFAAAPLAIHRASIGLKADTVFAYNAAAMREVGMPFGVYHYIKAATPEAAREEAQVFWETAAPQSPRFYAVDCEYNGIVAGRARAIVAAFRDEIKRLGAKRVGCYVGHHLYKSWNLDYRAFDFVWIPRYGSNDGTMQTPPDYPCDIWQYTSVGSLPGIDDKDIDINVMTGTGISLEELIAWT